MFRRRIPRQIPLRYDDGFRGGVAIAFSLPFLLAAVLLMFGSGNDLDIVLTFVLVCAAFVLFFAIYLFWTHWVFSGTDAHEATRIASLQYQAGASGASRAIGLRSAEEWAMFAAGTAMLVSIVASIIGARSGSVWLPILVLLTVITSWATVVYAFALRYFRLHSGGEKIAFDIDEQPGFEDFISMAVMVSSVGAMSAGTPRTRAGLTTVRTHTYISFAFNALVVAMVVSLITGFITSGTV